MTVRLEGLFPLLTGAEMGEWEARTFSGGQVSERVVLESAGRAVAEAVARELPEGRAVAVVGRGNNGGDAIVALRTLRAWGREVALVRVAARELPESLTHGWDLPELDLTGKPPFGPTDILIDGILGTGANGPPREPQAGAIREMNASGRPIVAVDGPSGVDLGSGAVDGEAVRAALTVSFGALKRGLLLYPGREHAGRILLAEVGFPPPDGSGTARVITDSWVERQLPPVPPDAHKGVMGLVGVVAGRHGFAGAAIMAAMGALRSGAGGVRFVSAEENRLLLQTAVPEAVFIDREAPDLLDRLQGVDALLVGPGTGTDATARALLERLLELELPVVADADAITLLAAGAGGLRGRTSESTVLTPHPGELARLLGSTIEEVLADRVAAAVQAAGRCACAVLSKGAPSVVAAPGLPILVNTTGHAGVATGGMGDTLGGVIAALLARGVSAYAAAAAGVHVAGRAAEIAGRGSGLLPRDVADALPDALRGDGNPAPPEPPFLFALEPAV